MAGLSAGGFAALPAFSGPTLNVATRAEFADHVAPGIVVAVSTIAALTATRHRRRPVLMLGAGLVVVLAGVWMTATHLPLAAQAARGEAPIGAVAYHAVAGLFALSVGVGWSAVYWREAGSDQEGRLGS